ncbi:hypothetical protein ACLB2K_032747 [Fragaria x ananassa]
MQVTIPSVNLTRAPASLLDLGSSITSWRYESLWWQLPYCYLRLVLPLRQQQLLLKPCLAARTSAAISQFLIHLAWRKGVTSEKNSSSTTAYLTTGDHIVDNISVDDGELRMLNDPAHICYDAEGNLTSSFLPPLFTLPFPYTISDTKNKFYTVGCDTTVMLQGFIRGEEELSTGCISICNSFDSINQDYSCSGVGCCQTNIPNRMNNLTVTLDWFQNNATFVQFYLCGYAFIAEQGQFNFSLASGMFNFKAFPMVVNWAIGTDSCDEAQYRHDFAGKANIICINRPRGYLCLCLPGYEGNPYYPDGCQDIDECKAAKPCLHEGAQIHQESTLASKMIRNDSTGGSLGLILVAVVAWWSVQVIKKRKNRKLKEKLFKQNGGLVLEQQLSSGDQANVAKIKLFNSRELEKATDNFSIDRVLGQGGQVNHRDVVKLLGCCLETEISLLVYEFLPNGTLSQYIHDQDEEFPLTWGTRLRVSTEVAGSLSYLHTAASIPIYHRDIKCTNILLDGKYRAKIADFGTSRSISISIDQTHLTTLVRGTFGYLDPEYFQSSQFTEKSDVYSFGVVLAELLTGQKPVSMISSHCSVRGANFTTRVVDGTRSLLFSSREQLIRGCTLSELHSSCGSVRGANFRARVVDGTQSLLFSSREQLIRGCTRSELHSSRGSVRGTNFTARVVEGTRSYFSARVSNLFVVAREANSTARAVVYAEQTA